MPRAEPAGSGQAPPGGHIPFEGIVLAGGRGSRVGGADKPALAVGGRAMVVTVVSALIGAGADRVIVVGPQRPELRGVRPPGGLAVVREEPPGGGPVPALARGLAEARAGLVALFAADLPFLQAEDVRRLVAMARPGLAGAIMVDAGGREQWLAGCWAVEPLRQALRGYAGRSLHGLLAPLKPDRACWEPAPGQPPPWLDCDTGDDVALARRWAGPEPPEPAARGGQDRPAQESGPASGDDEKDEVRG